MTDYVLMGFPRFGEGEVALAIFPGIFCPELFAVRMGDTELLLIASLGFPIC
jgi:hypothetical protein